MEAQHLLDKVNMDLLLTGNTTFYTTILFSLNRTWDENIPTACIGGTDLKLNPNWFKTLTKEEAKGLMVHEVNHICLGHLERCQEREHKKFNIAADHAINLQLLSEGWKLPKGGFADPQYEGMPAEAIYDLLEDDDEDYDSDISTDYKDASEEEKQALKSKIEEIVAKAVQASKIDGSWDKLPGNLRENVKKLLEVKLDWKTILANHLNTYAKDDYSLRKPNRRFMHMDLYMPSLYSEAIGDVNIGIDVSGSITNEQFIEFLSEVEGINETLKPNKMNIIQWHHEVSRKDTVSENMSILDIPLGTIGGTCINSWLNEIRSKSLEFAICITDGEWADEPNFNNINFPIYWIIFGNSQKEFAVSQGEIILY